MADVTEMASAGVKLITGDLDNPATYESALMGAHGVFINANCGYQVGKSAVPCRRQPSPTAHGAPALRRAGVGVS